MRNRFVTWIVYWVVARPRLGSAPRWARRGGADPRHPSAGRHGLKALDVGTIAFVAVLSVLALLLDRADLEVVEDYSQMIRCRHGAETARTGTFRTAPGTDIAADVRFAYTGDSDGTLVNGQPGFNNFEVLDAIRAEDPDFWVYLSDAIYADSGLRPTGPAMSVAEYRDAYEVNRGYPPLSDLLASTSTYAIWDDHEVHNDFDGQTVDPARYAAGRQAFVEWMPLTGGTLVDPSCAGDPLFRTFSWGSEVDVIVLDERSCRSADVGGDLRR